MTSTPDKEDGCEERGCFSDEISYNASVTQIEALMYISQQCEQRVKHTCKVNPLTGYAFWNDRKLGDFLLIFTDLQISTQPKGKRDRVLVWGSTCQRNRMRLLGNQFLRKAT